MEYLNDILKEIHNLRGSALVIVCLIAFGYVCKIAPFIPNRFIPLCVILGGAILNPILISTGEASHELRHPLLGLALEGFLVGVAAWILHEKVIAKLLARFGLSDPPPPKP